MDRFAKPHDTVTTKKELDSEVTVLYYTYLFNCIRYNMFDFLRNK